MALIAWGRLCESILSALLRNMRKQHLKSAVYNLCKSATIYPSRMCLKRKPTSHLYEPNKSHFNPRAKGLPN